MNKILRLSLICLLALTGVQANALTDVDELTWEVLGLDASSSSYKDFWVKPFQLPSGQSYKGVASSGQGKYIQLRSNKKDAGIYKESSHNEAKVRSVTIAFNEATTDRSVDIYVKNTPYEAVTDLYDEAKAGTKAGSIAANAENKTLKIEGEYKYVAICATNGAVYIDKISVEWDHDETGGQAPAITAKTVAEAQALLSTMAPNVKSDEVYVKGRISKIDKVDPGYGNATFYISDSGSEEGQLEVFRCVFLEKEKFTSADQIKVGDEVVICGQLVNYRSSKAAETDPVTPEFTQGCYIYSLNGKTKADAQEPVTPPVEEKQVDVAGALTIINGLDNGKTTADDYYLTGVVVSIDEISTSFGNATFNLGATADATDVVKVFRAKGPDNKGITDEDIIKVGDIVTVFGKLQKYVKKDVVTPEMSSCYITAVNASTAVRSVEQPKTDAPVYNLSGQRVEKAAKGVFIQNGRKFILK